MSTVPFPTRLGSPTSLAADEAVPAATSGAMGRIEWAVLGVCAAWITVVLLVRWPALFDPLFSSDSNIDSAFFGFAGELLRNGGTPYLSYWDHKPPLIHLVNAAALTLSGGQIWGLWFASLAALIVALVLGYRTLYRAYGGPGALLGITYFAFSLPTVLASNLTEEYALPLQWMAVLLLLRWRPAEDRTYTPGFLLGVLAGLSFFLRANLIGAAVSVGLVLSVVLLSQGSIRAWLRTVAGGLGGVALVSAAVLTYLAAHGSLGAFWDQAFHYNFLYSATTWGHRIRAAVAGLTETSAYGSFVLPFAGWAFAAYRLRTRGRQDSYYRVSLLCLIWLPVEVALASMSGRPYSHYFVTLFAPLSFLAARFAWEFGSSTSPTSGRSGWSWPRGAVAVLSAAIAIFAAADTLIDLRDKGAGDAGTRGKQVTAVVDYLRTHTDANDPIFVWGHAADIYFFSGRTPVSHFIYPLPLLTPGYADSALIEQFLDELRTRAPTLILDATATTIGGEKLVPPLDVWDPTWRYPEYVTQDRSWWSMTPSLKRFYDFIAENYTVVDNVGPQRWTVYRRSTSSVP